MSRFDEVEPPEGLLLDVQKFMLFCMSDMMFAMTRFHEVEPQEGLEVLPPSRLSRAVAGRPSKGVPFPALTENTLVLSSSMVVAPVDGVLHLMVRFDSRASPFFPCSPHFFLKLRAFVELKLG